MKHLPYILLLFLVLALAACSGGSTVDPRSLDTDEGVVKAFNRLNDGSDVVEDDLCIDRPRDLMDVVLVGDFAYDLGCTYSYAFVNGEYGKIRDLTPAGLAHNGWADENNRSSLALIWAQDVLFAEYRSVGSSNEDFEHADTPAYTEEAATLTADGGVVVEWWTEDPAGMLPETTYRLRHYEFDVDGNLVHSETLDSFTIEFE